MATWADLQSALTCSGSEIGPDRTIQAAAKGRVQAAFAAMYPDKFATANDVGSNDVSAWLGRQLAAFVKQQETKVAQAALTQPSDLDDA